MEGDHRRLRSRRGAKRRLPAAEGNCDVCERRQALERRLNALALSTAASTVSAELARSYAYAAVFHAGMEKDRAKNVALAANCASRAADVVKKVSHSETQALVNFKCGEYLAMSVEPPSPPPSPPPPPNSRACALC